MMRRRKTRRKTMRRSVIVNFDDDKRKASACTQVAQQAQPQAQAQRDESVTTRPTKEYYTYMPCSVFCSLPTCMIPDIHNDDDE